MSRRTGFAFFLLICLGAGAVFADGPTVKKDEDKGMTLARGLWLMTDVVLENHVDPPARQTMLLAAAKTLLPADAKGRAGDLAARVSRVTTVEQCEALFDELDKAAGRTAPDSAISSSALRALSASVPGGAHLISADALRLQEQIAGNRYVGTGIQIRFDDKEKLTQIVLPFPGGPARRAGAKANDLIVKVDGKDMAGHTLQQVVAALRGEEGTKVTMTVRQPGTDQTRDLPMTRGVVPFATVTGFKRVGEEAWQYRVDPETPVAYLRLAAINAGTLHDLRKAEAKLREEGAKALVLDLRFTGGGELHHVALVADGLLDGGVMWRLRDAKGQVKEQQADRDCLFRDWPMAVLVGGTEREPLGTALIAAALQDNNRAVVVGTKVECNPYVLSPIDLPQGRGKMMLPTAVAERAKPTAGPVLELDRPAGTWIEKPDHEVGLSAKQREAVTQWEREQDLPDPPAGAMTKPPEDPQLAKALELLRAKLKAKEKAD
jgi:carboxyl-terminal processing protease